MRILLTGATGFIGAQLGKALVKEGHEIVAMVRDPSRVDLPFPAQLISWNEGRIPQIEAVIHLAGESIAGERWSEKRKKEILESRASTTKKLVEQLKNSGVRAQVVICASAIGYYGDRADEWLTEDSSPGRGFLAEVCVSWEQATASFATVSERIVQMRIGIVLERFGGALVEILPLFKRGLGGTLGSGKQWMSWIHLEDLIGMFLLALKDSRVEGQWNAVAPEPVTNRDFTKILASTLKCKSFFPVPAFGLKVALGEMSALLLASQRVKEKFRSLGFSFRYPSLDSALMAICKNVERCRGLLTHEHRAETWLDLEPARAFQFFSDTKNLEKITPPEYELKVGSQSTVKPKEGTTFEYTMKCKNFQVSCKSHILEWVENSKMVSTHEKGPYAFWFHSLQFERMANGTLLIEKVIYRWKYGILGELFCQTTLKKNLTEIFCFRMKKAKELLR
jgi:uncharacterized protein (TIGR01777 family)